MAFDVEGARKEGYSEAEIADYLASQKKFDISGARKEGYSDADIISHLAGAPAPQREMNDSPIRAGAANFASSALGLPVDAIQAAINIPPELARTGLMAAGRYDLANQVPTLKGSVGGSEWFRNLLRPMLNPDYSGNAMGNAQYNLISRGGFIPGNVLPAIGSMAAEKTLGPDWAQVGAMGPQAAITGYNAARAPSLQRQAAENALTDKSRADAVALGFRTPPSAAGGNWLTDRLESIAGKYATGQQATVDNQGAVNAVARAEAGLPENQAISIPALEARRNVIAAPYREVEQLAGNGPLSQPPFRSPKDTLEELKQVRADANAQWKFYDRNADPATLKEAQKLSARAQQLESQIEAVAQASGKPGLVDDLRQARKELAKTYDIERALNVATGDVSLPTLGRMADSGKLSGGLDVAGKFQQAFPRYAREGEKMPPPGVSKSEALVALMAGLAGHATVGPYGWALAAAPLVSSPMRAALLSGPAQKAFQPSYSPALNPTSNAPLLYQLGILQQQ